MNSNQISNNRQDRLSQIVARFRLGYDSPSELIEFGVSCLLKGKDTPSLRLLAGLTPDEQRDSRVYFRQSLAETNYPEMSFRQAVYTTLHPILYGIATGQLSPYEGVIRIDQLRNRVCILISSKKSGDFTREDLEFLDLFFFVRLEWASRPELREAYAQAVRDKAKAILEKTLDNV